MNLLMQNWSIIGLHAATAGTVHPGGGTDPKSLSSSLVPTHLRSAGRLEKFLPGLGSQLDSILSWLCWPEV